MKEFQIGANEAGQRFDKYLHKLLPEAGNSFLYKMLRKKNIVLNGKKAEGKEILQEKDVVKLFLAEETFDKFVGEKKTISYSYQGIKPEIIWETKDILACNKPVGVLTQKASDRDESLNEWLIVYLLESGKITEKELQTFHPSVCNRLDRNTSGIVLCGKTLAGSQKLTEDIRNGRVGKFYRTFVKGALPNAATLEGFLYKEEQTNRVVIYKNRRMIPEGVEAAYIKTSYKPIQVFDDFTYVEIELHTGKTHQIRAHLASMGHPILGDSKYGDVIWNRRYRDVFQVRHQLLHAYRVELPGEHGKKTIIAPEPDIFTRILENPLR